MELNKWYVLEENNVDEFIRLAPTVNRAIVAYLNGRKFQVHSFEEGDPGGVFEIRFDNGGPISRLEALSHFKDSDWNVSWFYTDERAMFTEVTPEENYIIHVSGVEPTETCGDTGYIVGTQSTPQRFTLYAAKEHAKFILEGESANVQVHIFRLETTAKVITQVNFD